jgi:hypothetical protein
MDVDLDYFRNYLIDLREVKRDFVFGISLTSYPADFDLDYFKAYLGIR